MSDDRNTEVYIIAMPYKSATIAWTNTWTNNERIHITMMFVIQINLSVQTTPTFVTVLSS